MTMIEWAVTGALVLGIFIFCARVMRRGLSSLDDDRRQTEERIAEGKRKIAEEKKNISADEQIYLAEAAIRDLIRLDCRSDECGLSASGRVIEVRAPEGDWRIELLMRERSLRSKHKVLHGQSRWLLAGRNLHEEYFDLAPLMAALARQLRGGGEEIAAPPHLARRLAAARRAPGRNFSY